MARGIRLAHAHQDNKKLKHIPKIKLGLGIILIIPPAIPESASTSARISFEYIAMARRRVDSQMRFVGTVSVTHTVNRVSWAAVLITVATWNRSKLT